MNIRQGRSGLYRTARAFADPQAISKRSRATAKRVERRLLGRIFSRIICAIVGR